MSNTTYVDYTTPTVNAAWLNEINDHVWHDTPVSGTTIHNASVIKNTPAGGISATNIQVAINELDTKKVAFTRLDDSDGSSLVGFIQQGTGAVTTTVQDKLREYVSVKDFGAVGDGVADDTAAIQAAINYAVSAHAELKFSPSTYRVSSIVINGANGLRLTGRCTLAGKTSGSYEAVLVIKNSANVTIDGKFDISAQYNAGYDCGVTIYTDNATQASFIDIGNLSVDGAKLAWRIGKLGTYGASGGTSGPLVSEITIRGGHTYGCPRAVEAIGTQTFVHFVGAVLAADDLGGDGVTPGWSTLPKSIITAIGAVVYVTGGEVLLVQSASGYGVRIAPIADSVFGNKYGHVFLSNIEMECASQLLQVANTEAIPAPILGAVVFRGVSGFYSQDIVACEVYDSSFAGELVIRDCLWFSNITRTASNVVSASAACQVHVDDVSFSTGFIQGIQGIVGGVLHFERRCVLHAMNCNGQALPLATPTRLKFTALSSDDPELARFSGQYNASTGLFTVPPGGLRSIQVDFHFLTTQPSQPCRVELHVNGSYAQTYTHFAADGAGSWRCGSFSIPALPFGATIGLVVVQEGVGGAMAGGAQDYMAIYAKS